ncbi:MAG: hypothetical protein AMXMBFR59_20420 [Rhodanobacteraceae bacterium]
MFKSRMFCSIVSGVALLLVATSHCAASGGGEMPVDTATPRIQPEHAAIGGYLDGRLGVLWPSYDRRFLLIAFRVAGGLRAVSAADRAALTAPPDPVYRPPAVAIEEAMKGWLAARRSAGAADPAYDLVAGWRERAYFAYASNCEPHAFTMAARTLAARGQSHALETAELQQWIAAQDSVFSVCEPDRETLPMPALEDGAPEWLVRDRAYQNAALQFYRHDFAAAGAAFEAIAADPHSPWNEWAGYLRVRAWWRDTFRAPEDYRRFMAEVPDWTGHAMFAALQRASDAKDPAVRQAAAELRDALTTRFATKDALAAHWRIATAEEPPARVGDWVRDLQFIWAVASEAELTDDWIYDTRSLQVSNDEAARNQAFARLRTRWDSQRTPIVLASLLMAATPDTPELSDLVAASRESRPGDPLHLHVAWQRARLALTAGRLDEARRELDGLDTLLAEESLGTRQHFDQLAMLAASSLDVLARHLVRHPVAAEDPWTGYAQIRPDGAGPPTLDDETALWLATRVHGKDLLQLAKNAALPVPVRQRLAGEAWRWGALLPDEALELAALGELVTLEPDAAVTAALTARRLGELRFLAARRLLNGQVPRLASAGYGNGLTHFSSAAASESLTPASHWNLAPAFYDVAQRTIQTNALATLAGSNETTWMGKQILPWIAQHTDTADAPAILRQLVFASRYGAKDTPTSRQAFRLLHRLYPDSDEARETKYYY